MTQRKRRHGKISAANRRGDELTGSEQDPRMKTNLMPIVALNDTIRRWSLRLWIPQEGRKKTRAIARYHDWKL